MRSELMDELEPGKEPSLIVFDDDGDGFLPGQRHAIVSAILLLRLNAFHQQSLNAADITIRDS